MTVSAASEWPPKSSNLEGLTNQIRGTAAVGNRIMWFHERQYKWRKHPPWAAKPHQRYVQNHQLNRPSPLIHALHSSISKHSTSMTQWFTVSLCTSCCPCWKPASSADGFAPAAVLADCSLLIAVTCSCCNRGPSCGGQAAAALCLSRWCTVAWQL